MGLAFVNLVSLVRLAVRFSSSPPYALSDDLIRQTLACLDSSDRLVLLANRVAQFATLESPELVDASFTSRLSSQLPVSHLFNPSRAKLTRYFQSAIASTEFVLLPRPRRLARVTLAGRERQTGLSVLSAQLATSNLPREIVSVSFFLPSLARLSLIRLSQLAILPVLLVLGRPALA